MDVVSQTSVVLVYRSRAVSHGICQWWAIISFMYICVFIDQKQFTDDNALNVTNGSLCYDVSEEKNVS